MPSVASVSPISDKLGPLLVSHSLKNSGDLVSRDQFLLRPIKRLGFLVASFSRRTLCPKMSYTWSTVDMSDERSGQSKHLTVYVKFVDSGEMYSGIVILWHWFWYSKRQDNRPIGTASANSAKDNA